MKTIEDNNRMIAEFKSGKKVKWHHNQYHTSWNELIPVVNKIKTIDDSFMISEIGVYEIVENGDTPELSHYEYDVNETYKAVVEFIELYNQNK